MPVDVFSESAQNQTAGIGGAFFTPTPGTTLASVAGLANILAGLLLVAAFLFFFGGLATWALRLGMVGRDDGVKYMRWGVTMLFMLAAGLALINFIQFHTQIVLGLIAGAFVVLIAWIAVTFKSEGDDEAKDH